MCLGVLPSPEIATKYGLHEFYEIGKCIRCGDVRTFEKVMTECRGKFIRLGVYLVLEQTKMIVMRRFMIVKEEA